MKTSRLTIGVIDSDVLGLHGDNGNALVLKRRAEWRGIQAEVVRLSVSDTIPSSFDIYIMGAATRRGRQASLNHQLNTRGLIRALRRGTPLLAIMTSIHTLSEWYIDEEGDKHSGLELLDVRSVITPILMSFPLVTKPLIPGVDNLLLGHENHGGVTEIGPAAKPLGQVIYGSGNAVKPGQKLPAGKNKDEIFKGYEALRLGPLIERFDEQSPTIYEGAVQDSIIATYMHGPVLARNPQLADKMLKDALDTETLAPIETQVVDQARRQQLTSLNIDEQDILSRF